MVANVSLTFHFVLLKPLADCNRLICNVKMMVKTLKWCSSYIMLCFQIKIYM